MSTTTKSPLRVARNALAAGRNVFRAYAHRRSPKVYTQPQLFACLTLKVFFKTDYRGICQLLHDLPNVARAVGLGRVPHFTTLHKAAGRLLRRPRARRLLSATLRRTLRGHRRPPRVAFDSSGLECGHASLYFIRRRARKGSPWQTITYTRYAKLEIAVDCATHRIVGVLTGRGPRPDVDRFVPLLDETLVNVRPRRVLADAGYDSEPNHRYARETHRVLSFMPATLGRPSPKLPTGRHRRRMRQRLDKHYGSYGQRWQVETVFSMIKRRLANAVQARRYQSQCRELWLLALTYNLMLV
jgi:hypothetical protein